MLNKKLSVVAILVAALCGCSGKVELEDRAFAAAAAIDKNGGEISVTVSAPKFGEKDKIDWETKSASGADLRDCLSRIDKQSNGKLFLGQAKTIIFGAELLDDFSSFSAVVEEILTEKRFSNGAFALFSEHAEDVVKAEVEKEKNGFYVVNYLSSNNVKAAKISEVYRSLKEGEDISLVEITKELTVK